MTTSSKPQTQAERFKQSNPATIYEGLEHNKFSYCGIYNLEDPTIFMIAARDHLGYVIDYKFVDNLDDAEKNLSTMAEFSIWHLLLKTLAEFDEKFTHNAQSNQWISPLSPQFMDIYAVRKVNGKWRFYVIEVKWSEICDYKGQVRQGLVEDLQKLHANKFSSNRLTTHVSGLKSILRNYFSREEIREIFSEIDSGTTPSETKGIEFWGFFVSDWNINNQHYDPDGYFDNLILTSKKDGWPPDTVHGFMLHMNDGKNWLRKLAMGQC